MSQQILVKTKSFYVATKYFYVATELAKVNRIYIAIEFGLGWGFYVTIEYSYFATEFGLDRGF